ncbi:MAG: phosphoserine phosphatase SerB [Candidatus Gastranaerophilales bacterium]|nr:phosphoserine phosphatase SerB [Candidatus Gastranaerophilales bacterium]
MKLAVFDFDSTLMDGETIEFLANEFGIQEKVKAITTQAMEGKLDFFESLTQRVALLKGLKETRVKNICENLPFMPGAKETISELKKAGYTVICFSGGFKTATVPAKSLLGLDGEFANELHFKNGEMTGLVGGEMMFSHSKGQMIQTLQNILKVTPNNTIAVGDGANDLSMFKHADTRIAFCAKEILKREATITIEEKNLTKIIDNIL